MRKAEDYVRLIEQLAEDMNTLAELEMRRGKAERRLEAAKKSGAVDELDWAALGYTIHNIYCCMENYFLEGHAFFRELARAGLMASRADRKDEPRIAGHSTEALRSGHGQARRRAASLQARVPERLRRRA
jgi:hypothetical protein